MTTVEVTKMINEWIQINEEAFEHDGITDDSKFYYPINFVNGGRETEKAKIVQIPVYDRQKFDCMKNGNYTGTNGSSCYIQMWLPKKVLRDGHAPYGIVKLNLEKCASIGTTNMVAHPELK